LKEVQTILGAADVALTAAKKAVVDADIELKNFK
jgi:uncharacterized MnhB-related membrane protein